MSETTEIRYRNPANPWKLATIAMAAVISAVLVVGGVTAYFAGPDDEEVEQTEKAASQKTEQVRVVTVPAAEPTARPTSYDIAACNDYAASRANRTNEAVKHGLLGGAIGAGVGAATGAIADGGKGAGKGAGIGAIVGATAGTLYGLNRANQNLAGAEAAYRTCMANRGY
jgi:hypothetical protein